MSAHGDGEADLRTRLEEALGTPLSESELVLGSWGRADLAGHVVDQAVVAVEVERSQRHPNTNVLKYWPWMDEDRRRRVFLVQVFDRASANDSSRQRLATWVGARMERELGGRFAHVTVRRGSVDEEDQLRQAASRFEAWRPL